MVDGVDFADERLTAIGLFAEAFAGLSAKLTEQLAEHGLSGVDFEVLIRLARSPEQSLRMSDLSAQTSLTTSGATRVVDRLVAGGLVCRRACDSDRRSTYAVLTTEGEHRVADALPGHLEIIDKWLVAPLSDDQLDGLMSTLRLLRDGVNPCATVGTSDVSAGQPAGPR
jgi:MarR family transcriptional regulator, 2-MHQ and catechol-resistance regulon repressor